MPEDMMEVEAIPTDIKDQLRRLGLKIETITVSSTNVDWKIIDQETGQDRSPTFHSQDGLFNYLRKEFGMDVTTPPELALAAQELLEGADPEKALELRRRHDKLRGLVDQFHDEVGEEEFLRLVKDFLGPEEAKHFLRNAEDFGLGGITDQIEEDLL